MIHAKLRYTGSELCMYLFWLVCWLVMLPAAVTQHSHHHAEEGKFGDLEAARVKMERLMCAIILAYGNNRNVEVQCVRGSAEI